MRKDASKTRLKRCVFLSNINVSKRLYGFVYGEKIDTQSFKNIENQTDYTYLTLENAAFLPRFIDMIL